ncbi:hypothetical protein V5P93_004215 [Actinokineospora auranticolor]|uniref:Uncharacterized protein n=1 Tax=Actinokineospora auranticolor TaxID=155976 RepID=A0A2S6GIL2_9PSEU|nr:hypothetical protein [Actinokineospora auranticolor]PPK65040.1 hypothetical protein CLV40_11683 [Actinokineospora auranticolor]
MDRFERDVLTMLCAGLPELRQECANLSADRKALLDRIEVEAASRRPVARLVSQLLECDPEDIVEARRGPATGLPGAGGGRADDEVFGCPDDSCNHRARTVPAGEPPRCALLGLRMRRL